MAPASEQRTTCSFKARAGTMRPASGPTASDLHSSSVVELPNSDLLACWFHGSGERTADDVLIQGSRWNHATGKWTDRFRSPFLLRGGTAEQRPVSVLVPWLRRANSGRRAHSRLALEPCDRQVDRPLPISIPPPWWNCRTATC